MMKEPGEKTLQRFAGRLKATADSRLLRKPMLGLQVSKSYNVLTQKLLV